MAYQQERVDSTKAALAVREIGELIILREQQNPGFLLDSVWPEICRDPNRPVYLEIAHASLVLCSVTAAGYSDLAIARSKGTMEGVALALEIDRSIAA